MATVAPITRARAVPDSFVEALNGYVVGIVSLEFVRRAIAVALERDARAAPAVQTLMDDAFHEGRLAAEDYETLSRGLTRPEEDPPTEWSEDSLPAADDATGAFATITRTGGTSLRPGSVLRDRYVLQSRVDSGGMADVFKALDRRRQEAGALNPWLAIKVVGPGTARFEESLRLLQQEAALAQRLEHPGIVRVCDFDRDGDYAFITMEWLDGESLAMALTRQRNRPLTVPHAAQVLNEIGDALAFAHARGVVHADVKPGNIFLSRDGPARLLDFGIAQAVGTGAAIEARTPAYASAEVLEGRPATAQDDVYSLACVAYRLLAGRRAFGHGDALAAGRNGRRPAPIRTLGTTQWRALERALELRREDRTSDVETFLAEFNARPASAHDAAGFRERFETRTPRRAMVGAAAALVVVVSAVGVIAWRMEAAAVPEPVVATPSPAAVVPSPPIETAQTVAARQPAAVPPAAAPVVAKQAPAPPKTVATASAAPPKRPARAAVVAKKSRLAADKVVALNAGAETLAAPAREATPGVQAAGQQPDLAQDMARNAVPLKQLRFRRYVEPEVRQRGRDPEPTGWVELQFLVDTEGVPRNIAVVDAGPPGYYDPAALAAVKRWRFVPVKENGVAVERRTSVRLRFQPE